MIRKVIIAEDFESASISVQKTLTELNITDTDFVFYCDDALTHMKQCVHSGQSYDLLITDLSFEEDEKKQTITNGVQLITAARAMQPDIKVLVFSVTKEAAVIEKLYSEQQIDAYVRKARNDAKELKAAIETINKNQQYFPRHLMQDVQQKNAHEFTPFDIAIISLLAAGTLQKDIPFYLQQKNIKPSGLSSVEKRLNYIKEVLSFTKNEQLVAFCKDKGII